MNTSITAQFFAQLILTIVAIAPSQTTETAELRLMTYNVHHCEGVDRKLDVDRIAQIINNQKCDIVALQEIDRKTTRSDQVDQLERLAELTGLKPFFGKSIDYGGGEYGVGVLSKLPIIAHKTWPLPTAGKREQRVALELVVQPTAGDAFIFACTHLDHSQGENDRGNQTDALNKLFGGGPRQAILAGDFNASVPRPEMAILLDKWADVDATKLTPTIPVSKPTLKIDYIFVQHDSPWMVVSSQVLNERIASDHLPLVATLRKKVP